VAAVSTKSTGYRGYQIRGKDISAARATRRAPDGLLKLEKLTLSRFRGERFGS